MILRGHLCEIPEQKKSVGSHRNQNSILVISRYLSFTEEGQQEGRLPRKERETWAQAGLGGSSPPGCPLWVMVAGLCPSRLLCRGKWRRHGPGLSLRTLLLSR